RVLLPFLGLYLALRDNRLRCYDAATGEEIGDYTEITRALAEAEHEARAHQQAREQAERTAHAQQQAREEAERQAREVAEQLVREQLVRADAEQRLRALEAELL